VFTGGWGEGSALQPQREEEEPDSVAGGRLEEKSILLIRKKGKRAVFSVCLRSGQKEPPRKKSMTGRGTKKKGGNQLMSQKKEGNFRCGKGAPEKCTANAALSGKGGEPPGRAKLSRPSDEKETPWFFAPRGQQEGKKTIRPKATKGTNYHAAKKRNDGLHHLGVQKKEREK